MVGIEYTNDTNIQVAGNPRIIRHMWNALAQCYQDTLGQLYMYKLYVEEWV